MASESISFDITASGDADRKFRQTGDAALYASGKIDIAAASVRAFDDATAKMGKASTTSQNALKASTKALATLAEANRVVNSEFDKSIRYLQGQSNAFDDVAKKTDKAGNAAKNATSGFSALAGSGGNVTGMGALIGAGVALAPILVTVGFGLTGLAAAAYGIAKPIENAAQKTGGLAQNLHSLNPEQQQVARSLLDLGKTFAQFEHDLQPVVLGDFNKALWLARGLLTDIEPVAAATGKALGNSLGSIGAEFQSGQWQSFFQFMGQTAGTDIRLLTNNFVDLLKVLPPLLRDMQPLSTFLLKVTDAVPKTIGLIQGLISKLNEAAPKQENIFQKIGDGLDWLQSHAPDGHKSLGQLIQDWLSVNHAQTQAAWSLHTVNSNLAALSITWPAAGAKAAPLTDQITRMAMAGNAAFHAAGPATDQITRLGNSSAAAAGHVKPLTDQITMTAQANERAFRSAGPLTDVITNLAIPAKAAAVKFVSIATAITAINTAEQKSLTNMTTYAGDLVTAANDAHTLEQALKKSGNEIGLQTAAQRASFGDANTYIGDLSNTATQAVASGKGVNGAITAIRNGLPVLDSAKSKNHAYWEEVKTLVGWLHQLQNLKAIHETVYVSGNGTFTVRPGTKVGLPGGTAGGPFAAGGRVPGSGNSDSYAAMLTPGEVVVPKRMVSAGAVDHLRGSLPGFAAGGLVPSYSGSVAGLKPWSRGDLNATVSIFEQTIAKATLAGIRSAQASAASSFGGTPGPGGGSPAANAALAHRLYAAQLTPQSWIAWNYVAMRESGWNQYARNPSSGAYGIPQALPPTKMPFAAQAAGGSNPRAQINWMWNYMAASYGGPLGAAAHEAGYGWYDRGGILKPGLTLAYNGTGRPEMVLPNSGRGALKLEVEWVGGNGSDEFLTFIRKNIRIRGGNVQRVLGVP